MELCWTVALLALAPSFSAALRGENTVDAPTWREKNTLEVSEVGGSPCTMRTVTDPLTCGVQSVQKEITDAASCGTARKCIPFVGCHNVPKVCRVSEQVAKTCEVLDVCPVSLSARVEGSASIGRITDIKTAGRIVDIKVEHGVDVVRTLINQNRHLVLPMLDSVVSAAVEDVNVMIKDEVEVVKAVLIGSIRQQRLGRYFTAVNSEDAESALERVLSQTFSSLGGSIAPRVELEQAPVFSNWRSRLCHRLLRVRVQDTEQTFVISNWTDAVIARAYNEADGCETIYSGQCALGVVVEKKQCPFQPPVVQRYCLWGIACWRRWFTIQGSQTVTLAQLDGAEVKLTGKELYVDHVPRPRSHVPTFPRVGHAPRHPQPGATALSGRDVARAGRSDSQVDMKVPGFQENLVHEMCKNAGRSSWLSAFKSLRQWKCKGLLGSICHWAAWTGTVPVEGAGDVKIKVSLRDTFSASFVPDWVGIERKLEKLLLEELGKRSFPMDAKVMKVILALAGEGEHLRMEPNTTMYVDAQIDMKQLPPAVVR